MCLSGKEKFMKLRTGIRCSFYLFVLSFFIGCNQTPANQKAEKTNAHITILVQPFAGIDSSSVKWVIQELKKVYPFVQVSKPISLPSTAFNKNKTRYRADSLIAFLNKQATTNQVIIGLTAKDISTTKDAIEDWGVMGLGYCPGQACIASLYRLTKGQKNMQLFKVAIHELGHTQGLPHCPVTTCFMRDAEGKNPTNQEIEFCASCKMVLVKKGWSFGNEK